MGKEEHINKETGIWDWRLATMNHKCDYLLAGAIATLFKPKRFADLGCGNGEYCHIFHYGYRWPIVNGYEGTDNIQWVSVYNNIQKIDLGKEAKIKEKYDLVMSLEVGEHIPENKENIFLDNVTNFASRDVVLSWAVPGQGGKGHVNEKYNKWVIDRMNDRNFSYDECLSNYLRKHSQLRWFKNTIMVFKYVEPKTSNE